MGACGLVGENATLRTVPLFPFNCLVGPAGKGIEGDVAEPRVVPQHDGAFPSGATASARKAVPFSGNGPGLGPARRIEDAGGPVGADHAEKLPVRGKRQLERCELFWPGRADALSRSPSQRESIPPDRSGAPNRPSGDTAGARPGELAQIAFENGAAGDRVEYPKRPFFSQGRQLGWAVKAAKHEERTGTVVAERWEAIHHRVDGVLEPPEFRRAHPP